MGFVESPSVFFLGGGELIFSPIRTSLCLEIRSIPPGQKPFPLGRHIPIWLMTFEKNIQKFRKLPEERGHPAAIVTKYLSEVKFDYRKTAP